MTAQTPDQIAALKAEAVAAWRAVQENANEETATDLGVKVNRFAQASGFVTRRDRALAVVRAAGQAEIDAEAQQHPEQAAAAPAPAEDPAAVRKAAWARLSKAYRANRSAPTEETAAELGAASHAFGRIDGISPEEATRKMRTAVWRAENKPRMMLIQYVNPRGAGTLAASIHGPLADMRDVDELREQLRKLPQFPNDAIIVGWSPFDAA